MFSVFDGTWLEQIRKRWIIHIFTEEQKQQSVRISKLLE